MAKLGQVGDRLGVRRPKAAYLIGCTRFEATTDEQIFRMLWIGDMDQYLAVGKVDTVERVEQVLLFDER